MVNKKSIGQRIRKEREKLGLSRQGFAEHIALSDYYVGQLERGERQMSLNVLVNISNCLHVSLDYLVFGTRDQNPIYLQETADTYNFNQDSHNDTLLKLISKCSIEEKELLIKLIKTILPYTGKK